MAQATAATRNQDRLDATGLAPAGGHLAPLDPSVGDDEDVDLAALRHDRRLRHDQCGGRWPGQAHGHEHARLQQAVRIGDLRADRDGARDRVDARVDRA
ncbi:MAG TPA: hypothetical protein PKE47_01790, partial [Verrucomicrobiota bacterium]|nr:hypothetical protein [Verrucomicrobiota bacterium]